VDWEYFYSIGSSTLIPPDQVRAPEEALKRVFGFGPWLWQQWAALQMESFTRFQADHERDFTNANFVKIARDLWEYWVTHKSNRDFRALYESIDVDNPDKDEGFIEKASVRLDGKDKVRKPVGCADKLTDHILSPFRVMDDIAKNKDGKYTLVGDVSLFTYVSFLGSGWITALVTLSIQFAVPGILLYSAMSDANNGASSGPSRFPSIQSPPVGNTTWQTFCSNDGYILGRLMNVVVLLLYTIRVLPNLLYELYSTSGEDDTGSSKMDEVRRQVFEAGDDTLFMQIGYKLDVYANSVYVVILMSIMLFILFITDDIFSIILNALALEFVAGLDEELCSGDWYDPGGRYITAGAGEIMLRMVLQLEWMENPEKMREAFDISNDAWARAMCLASGALKNEVGEPITEADYDAAWAAHKNETVEKSSALYKLGKKIYSNYSTYLDMGLYDPREGRRAIRDLNLMGKEGRFTAMSASYAVHSNNKAAIWQFKEVCEQFGVVDRILVALGLIDYGIYNRFHDYTVWNRWTKILFTCATPVKGEYNSSMLLASNRAHALEITKRRKEQEAKAPKGPKETASVSTRGLSAIASSVTVVGKSMKSIGLAEGAKEWITLVRGGKVDTGFLNFDKEDFDLTPIQRFMELLKDKVLLKGLAKGVGIAVRRGEYHEIPFRVLDGLIEWFSTVYQLSFGFVIAFFAYLVLAWCVARARARFCDATDHVTVIEHRRARARVEWGGGGVARVCQKRKPTSGNDHGAMDLPSSHTERRTGSINVYARW